MFRSTNNNSVASKNTKSNTPSILGAAIAATVGGMLLATPAVAVDNITSITTQFFQGTPSDVNGVPGGSIDPAQFTPGSNYDLHYSGGIERVLELHTATNSYNPMGLADLVITRRGIGANNDIVWYKGNGNPNDPNVNLDGEQTTYNEIFRDNNVLVGIDNAFANKSDPNANNSNIERIDYIFTGGFDADPAKILSIMERGLSNEHDPFQVAAILGLDGLNQPNAYGALLPLPVGSWGQPEIVPATNYVVLRSDNGTDDFEPTVVVNQPIGGVVIKSTELASAGTRIYGYSLFAPDVTGSGGQLLDWTNPNFYPTTTPWDNGLANSGGLDPLGVNAVVFDTSTTIPEPSMIGLVAFAAIPLLTRRTRRQRKA